MKLHYRYMFTCTEFNENCIQDNTSERNTLIENESGDSVNGIFLLF